MTGKTLAEVARMRGKTPEDANMDLVLEDQSRVGTIYFLMSNENLKRAIRLPWVLRAGRSTTKKLANGRARV